jgi:hypothetical protein
MGTVSGNSPDRRGLMVVVIAVCVCAAAVWPAAAQQSAASIIGQVTDESGGVLPGVAVTATSPALQVPDMVAISDARGGYRLSPLPIGTYTLVYTLSGFQTVRRENVRLTVGFVAQVDVSLRVGSLEESVTVSGASPIIDVTSAAPATMLTRETLELTPTSRNGIISLLAQVPSVRANLDVGGGTLGDPPTYRLHGMEAQSWVTLEGVITSDARHGGNYFNYSAFDEARVQSSSNDASVASRGVAVTMVTKSGGDTFHGSGLVGYENRHLQSNNIDSNLAAQGITSGNPLLGQTDQGGDLGGRIKREKVWFYGAARYRTQDRQIAAAFRPDGSPRDSYQGEVILDGKVSAQLNPSNRLIGFTHWSQKYTRSEGGQFNQWGSGIERCCPPLRTHVDKIEWEVVRKSLVTSLQFGGWGWTAPINVARMSPAVSIMSDETHGNGRPATFDQVTQYVTGTDPSSGNFDVAKRYHTRGALTWYRPGLLAGNHDFKAGFDYIRNQIGWEYYSRGAVGEYRLILNNGSPFQIDTYNNPATPRTRAHHVGAYVTDTWAIDRRLTLNLGARYAHDNAFVPPQCRAAGQFAPAACIDEIDTTIWNSLAPRLYASYDLGTERKTVLKGGWGRFNHMRTEDEILQLNPFVATISTYRWRDLNGNRNYDAGEVNLDPNGPDFIRSVVRDTGTLTSNAVANPNEKQPGIDQFSLSLERELAANMAFSISGVRERSFNEPRALNLLRPYESYNVRVTNPDPGPDGIVGTPDDPGRLIAYYEYPVALAGRDFQRTILVADPRSNETHDTIELTLTKRMANRWQMLASYSATKNHALSPKTRGTVYHAAAALDPNAEFNTGDYTWEWLGRLSGVYVLPAGVTASANYDHRSGLPQARQVLFRGGTTIPSITLNVDPLGTLRLPNINVVDIRADKSFVLPNRQRMTLRVNMFNSLNANAVTSRTVLSGASYLRPTGILGPRIFEFVASYDF